MNNRFAICALSLLLVVFTTSCGPIGGTPQKTQPQNTYPSSESLTGQNGQSPTTSALEAPSPIALPPQYGSRPPKPGETQSATMPNGLPALQPRGVNVGNLFEDNISDTGARFDRLENAVTGLRREFESFKPAIVRLVAVESDIQDLITQLDLLLRSEPTAPPAQITAQKNQPDYPLPKADQVEPLRPQAAMPKVAASSQAPYAQAPPGSSVVKAMRTGKHSSKLRLVLDASKKTPFTVDLDAQENLLIIELPEAGWDAPRQKSYGGSSLIQSHSVESINNGKGSRVVLTLRKSTQLLKQQALPPGNNPNYRIFLDLKL